MFPSSFDLVEAAESLLKDAKSLAGRQESDPRDIPTRRRIAETCRRIAFETAPKVDVVKSDWVVFANAAVINLFISWSAFDHIPLGGSISFSELAVAIDAEESLVARLCSLLLSTSTLSPGPTPSSVAHSRISPLFLSTCPVAPMQSVAIGNGMKPYSHWVQYFSAYGRREPCRGQTHTPFSYAWGRAELPPWEVKALWPEYAESFTKAMKAREIIGGNVKLVGEEALYDFSWVVGHNGEIYLNGDHEDDEDDDDERGQNKDDNDLNGDAKTENGIVHVVCEDNDDALQDDKGNKNNMNKNNMFAKTEQENNTNGAVYINGERKPKPNGSVKVVDVGGGLGQLLRDLIRDLKGLKGEECVLQDRKEVIEQAERERQTEKMEDGLLLKGVRMMEHDFHEVQPVKGALVYILKRILLDYSDELAVNILRRLADALPEDDPRARVIIMEERLLEEPIAQNRIVDLVMLNLGGKLRNERLYRELAKQAGLRVVKYYARTGDPVCVVECARV